MNVLSLWSYFPPSPLRKPWSWVSCLPLMFYIFICFTYKHPVLHMVFCTFLNFILRASICTYPATCFSHALSLSDMEPPALEPLLLPSREAWLPISEHSPFIPSPSVNPWAVSNVWKHRRFCSQRPIHTCAFLGIHLGVKSLSLGVCLKIPFVPIQLILANKN